MAIEFDTKKWEQYIRNLEKVGETMDSMFRQTTKGVAAREMDLAMQGTPVDTGYLRESWFIGDVITRGNAYEIRLRNPVEYASYVEFGHRNRGHTSWIKGKFMLKKAEEEISKNIDEIVEYHILDFLYKYTNARL